jgi:Arc/MetJ family transcription regulator
LSRSHIRPSPQATGRQASVDIDTEKLDKVQEILGTEFVRETISAAFREATRIAAVRDAVALGELGSNSLSSAGFYDLGSTVGA